MIAHQCLSARVGLCCFSTKGDSKVAPLVWTRSSGKTQQTLHLHMILAEWSVIAKLIFHHCCTQGWEKNYTFTFKSERTDRKILKYINLWILCRKMSNCLWVYNGDLITPKLPSTLWSLPGVKPMTTSSSRCLVTRLTVLLPSVLCSCW